MFRTFCTFAVCLASSQAFAASLGCVDEHLARLEERLSAGELHPNFIAKLTEEPFPSSINQLLADGIQGLYEDTDVGSMKSFLKSRLARLESQSVGFETYETFYTRAALECGGTKDSVPAVNATLYEQVIGHYEACAAASTFEGASGEVSATGILAADIVESSMSWTTDQRMKLARVQAECTKRLGEF